MNNDKPIPNALRRVLETLTPAEAREVNKWAEMERNPITKIIAVVMVRAIKS